jgi:hypothetical protein
MLSRCPFGRRMTNARRLPGFTSREYMQTLSIDSTSAWVKGFTCGLLNLGAGISFIGFGILNSLAAQVKNDESVTQKFLTVLGESRSLGDPKLCGTYSVRNQLKYSINSLALILTTFLSSPMYSNHFPIDAGTNPEWGWTILRQI